MPFVAYLEDRRVDAEAMPAGAWAALKTDPRREQLVLPECGARAVAKTSRRGRQFFAHHADSGCGMPHSFESEAHRALKSVIAARINAAPGWQAIIEYTEDRSWITDVMAISRAGARIAFEVQLSSQTEEVYAARTQRYFDAGVHTVWVVPRHLEDLDLQVPQIETAVFKSTPVPEDPEQLLAHRTYQWLVRDVVDVGEALDRVLAGRLTWHHGPSRQQWPQVLSSRARRVEADRQRRELKGQKAAAKHQANREAIEDFRARVADAEQRRGARRA